MLLVNSWKSDKRGYECPYDCLNSTYNCASLVYQWHLGIMEAYQWHLGNDGSLRAFWKIKKITQREDEGYGSQFLETCLLINFHTFLVSLLLLLLRFGLQQKKKKFVLVFLRGNNIPLAFSFRSCDEREKVVHAYSHGFFIVIIFIIFLAFLFFFLI